MQEAKTDRHLMHTTFNLTHITCHLTHIDCHLTYIDRHLTYIDCHLTYIDRNELIKTLPYISGICMMLDLDVRRQNQVSLGGMLNKQQEPYNNLHIHF